MTKISDFTRVQIPLNIVAYTHIVDTSAGTNKKVQIKELRDAGYGFSLAYGTQIAINNAAVLTLNATPVKVLDGAVIAPNYNMLYGLLVEYFYLTAAFETDTELAIVDANGVELSVYYDVLGNTSNKKFMMMTNYGSSSIFTAAHISGNIYLKAPTADPTAGGGFLNVVPVYRTIITF